MVRFFFLSLKQRRVLKLLLPPPGRSLPSCNGNAHQYRCAFFADCSLAETARNCSGDFGRFYSCKAPYTTKVALRRAESTSIAGSQTLGCASMVILNEENPDRLA